MESKGVVVKGASMATLIAILLVLIIFFSLPFETSADSSTPIPSSNKYRPTPHHQKSSSLTSHNEEELPIRLPPFKFPPFKRPPFFKRPPRRLPQPPPPPKAKNK
ncbi:hypothetical protein FRX31_014886 [Thalictrum thalictroides]|uniref:Transmembrane protein n=1 Tax=Thalictrum thalictroides TaxID=46969 RepID=A0A7J6WDL4_THATH|nr:hypothetical protein FRX31_014886 [Thalictrum thalictroides]